MDDVNVLFPLLAGANVDPRSGEQALPPPPVHDPERSVKRLLEDSGGAGEGGKVAGEEGDGDMEVEIPFTLLDWGDIEQWGRQNTMLFCENL